MAVMAWGYAVSCACVLYLLILQFPVSTPCFRKSRLEKTSSSTAAVIVRPVGSHVYKILFADNSFNHKSQIFGDGISETLPYKLAGILNREFHLQFLVPLGIDLQLSFPDPLGIILNDALNFKIVGDVEFFQSGPDCKEFVSSLRIEPDFTFQILHRLYLDFNNVFP